MSFSRPTAAFRAGARLRILALMPRFGPLASLALPLLVSCGGPLPAAAPAPSGLAAVVRPIPPPAPSTPEDEPPLPPPVAPPAPIPPPGNVKQVVALDVRGCAIFDNGMLQCWGGFNSDGELGLGHSNEAKTPGWVKGIHDVKKLALGSRETCAVLGSGELHCWGRNWFLDNDTRQKIPMPTRVPGLSGVVDVAVGGEHACAVDTTGSVFCWGGNSDGQLGLGASALRTETRAPTKVPGISDAVGVLASNDGTVVWTRSGDLLRWGDASDSKRSWAALEPTKVDGISGVKRAWMGGPQTCALIAANEVRCFTIETLTALAAGKQYDLGPELVAFAKAFTRKKFLPAPANMIVPDGRGLAGVVDVAVFNHDASALTEKGEVYSWGSAKQGTVGKPERTKGFFPPTRILGLADVVQIAGSYEHRCALDKSGKVRCFGSATPGRFGNDSAKSSVSAVEVAGLPRITSIASGDHCTFALGEDHTLWVWGASWIHSCGRDDGNDHAMTAPQLVQLDTSPP
jgi:alpha-tubulin suppressor-like RCC1 family protein